MFKVIADGAQADPAMQSQNSSVALDTRPYVPDPFAGPSWPRWYAQGPEDLVPDDTLGYRMILMILGSLFGFTLMVVIFTMPFALPLFLVALPIAFVKAIGRHALPYSRWNMIFWTLYLGGYFAFLAFS